MKIALIYFSATGNTKQIAEKIKQIFQDLGAEISEYDITNHQAREISINFSHFDASVFGFPVYGWRVPRILRKWYQRFQGDGIKCSAFLTYGGVNPGVAHYEIQQILKAQGFKLLSTAEFLAEHTYNMAGWKAAVNRPNKLDFFVAEQFAKLTYNKFKDNGTLLPTFKKPKISQEKLEKIEKTPRRVAPPPQIKANLCTNCGICSQKCSTGAIDCDSLLINSTECIRCYRCVKLCPENAIKTSDLSRFFQEVKKIETISDAAKSKYFI